MELDAVADIFAEKRVMRAAIDAVLEGRCGDAVLDGSCARLDLGFFAILAGDAAVAAAAPLVGAAPPPRVFIAADEWHDLIRRALPDAEPHVERRTRFSADGLEDTKLAALRGVWTEHFNPPVAAHRGRIVKMMGDGALIEFASAVDSVECAVAIQIAMANYNRARPDREPMSVEPLC